MDAALPSVGFVDAVETAVERTSPAPAGDISCEAVIDPMRSIRDSFIPEVLVPASSLLLVEYSCIKADVPVDDTKARSTVESAWPPEDVP